MNLSSTSLCQSTDEGEQRHSEMLGLQAMGDLLGAASLVGELCGGHKQRSDEWEGPPASCVSSEGPCPVWKWLSWEASGAFLRIAFVVKWSFCSRCGCVLKLVAMVGNSLLGKADASARDFLFPALKTKQNRNKTDSVGFERNLPGFVIV